MKRFMRRLLCVSVCALLPVSAAQASGEYIGLSYDGVTWANELTTPLFDPDFRWVPGDSETFSFFVRNDGPTGAEMTLAVIYDNADPILAEDIALSARVSGGDWVELVNGAVNQQLSEQILDLGEIVRVDVNAVFDPTSTNQSQRRELGLTFVVTLADGLNTPPPTDATGSLPQTGADMAAWPLWIAALMIGSGLALLIRRRRDDETEVSHG